MVKHEIKSETTRDEYLPHTVNTFQIILQSFDADTVWYSFQNNGNGIFHNGTRCHHDNN